MQPKPSYGPIAFSWTAGDGSAWARYFLGGAADILGWPAAFAAAPADFFTRAHNFFWEALPMPSEWPIVFSEAADNGFCSDALFFWEVLPIP